MARPGQLLGTKLSLAASVDSQVVCVGEERWQAARVEEDDWFFGVEVAGAYLVNQRRP